MPHSKPIRAFVCVWIACCAQFVGAGPIRPSTERIDAMVSYPLVIPILATNERDLRSGVMTRLDDGRTLNSQAYWVGISPVQSLPGWTTSRGIWTATPYRTIAKLPRDQRPIGSWFIHIPLPIDAVGQGLWIDGERYELNWLPDPERAMLEAKLDRQGQNGEMNLDAFWSRHLPEHALDDPAVRAVIDQYHHDPFQNWRARLLTDGLDPNPQRAHANQSLDALELELAIDTPGADLLGELSKQYQARWQIILGRIWLIDPSVADRLKSQLMATARFGERTLPIWASDTSELSRLAHDLLSPFVDDQTRVLRAKAWLDMQPRALAWVADDQGQIEAGTNRFIPTISILSLPPSPGASLFRVDAPSSFEASSPELSTIMPNIASTITVSMDPIPLAPSNPVLESAPIRIRTGRWNAIRQVIASPTPARAPYVRIGPLLNDWTMDALYTNRPLAGATTARTRSAAGILRKTSTPSRSDPTDGWQLYFELTSPAPSSDRESLTLWVGPLGTPGAVWTIHPDGSVSLDAGSKLALGIPRVQCRILDDRWIAMIDLPRGVFDADNILQLGIERTDANGIHTAWPRRMIPDQPQPGRLSIMADNFDQLHAD